MDPYYCGEWPHYRNHYYPPPPPPHFYSTPTTPQDYCGSPGAAHFPPFSTTENYGSLAAPLARPWPSFSTPTATTKSSEKPQNCAEKHVQFEWMKKKGGKNAEKKKQNTFSRLQSIELEKEFLVEPYLKNQRRAEIAKRLEISEEQVKTWFQNRRQREKNLARKRADMARSSSSPEE
ncbi:unnamed protein product [Caenorhabditis sp. 36 PRJEB53466]|nr:unnamed protein product [Caenorhabditis sp. 36 PRJEB53466]